ncbi:MAG: ankyrin repeat domain-containing protein [Oscillospiraceae bacterium]|nr:ankyrin repeat domain-containing protein [Oscillospiraceae bacterium]
MRRGDPEEIKACFQDPEMLKFLTESKESYHNPLFQYSPCTEIYKWFVEQGFDINMKKSGEEPIHEHALCEDNNIEGLILAGADIEAKDGFDDDGATPLEIAAQSLQPSSMKVLIKYGADVHIKRYGKGLLHTVLSEFRHGIEIYDIEIKAFECMELLINAGVEIEDGMKDEIIGICKEFDKRKNDFVPYQKDPQSYEDGVDRMCELFGVERPAAPVVHDGKSPITVISTDWRDQHAELWDMLVPKIGKCKTVQGEVVRIGGKINDEIFNQGGAHWDAEFRKMLNALKKYYEMGTIPDEAEHQEALALIKSIGKNSDGEDVLRLCEINIHWVLANPEPIELGEVNYKR